MKNVGQKSIIIDKVDFINEREKDLSLEIASKKCFIDIEETELHAIKIKLDFIRVNHILPNITMGTYFMGRDNNFGQADIIRYLDQSTCEIIFKKNLGNPVFIHKICFQCKDADLNMNVEVFDITKYDESAFLDMKP